MSRSADLPRPAANATAYITPLVALALGITWLNGGLTFLAFKVGVSSIPAIYLAAVRFTIAGVVLLPVAIWRMRKRERPDRRQFAAAALMGVVMLVGGQTLTLWGVGHLPAGVASVFGSAPPLFLALFAWVVIRHPLGARQLAGIGIGLAGLALTAVSSSGITGFEPIGAVAVLTSTAIWARGSLLAHRMNLPADQTVSVTVQLLTAGVVLGASTLATGTAKSTNVGDLPATVWAALGFLTFFSTLVGYGLFTWLNTTASSTLANTYNYVSPVIAICLAASFLHEPLSWPKAGAAIVALLGVALMVTGSTAKAGSLDAPSQCQHLGASLTQTHSP